MLSSAERIEIDFPELRQDRARKVAAPENAPAAESPVRARRSTTIGLFFELHGLPSPSASPIKGDDDMIGHWKFQVGFKLSAEDLPVRLSATTS